MVKIFIDFDGTITRKDVGDELFEKFGGTVCKSHVSDYRRGLIIAVECFRLESAACGEINRSLLDGFILQQDIDPSVRDFFQFCGENGFECCIVSDGMDYYIGKILAHNGIGNVPYFANHLELIPAGRNGIVTLCPSFPFTDEECDRCACCKRNIMLSCCADDDLIVYIGEGYSDRCPVRYADIIFSKDDLLRFCREEKIPHSEYSSFLDVLRILKGKTGKKNMTGKIKLKKRRQAQLACRDVFIGG
jgi:2-hydroxy-3-keto-5-methylthiopentenyl-1-phosphate phosphatase